MKKILTLVFVAILMFGISSPVDASEKKDIAKALEMIEQTNLEIDAKIENGVKRADKLFADYQKDIQELEENKKLKNDPESKEERKQKLTANYEEKRDRIIDMVFNETLEMSRNTIERASELGVMAECSWVLIRFGDKSVWIDPVRVVGLKK